MRLKEKEHQLTFVVVLDGHGSLGDKACENLGLVKWVYCINKVSPNNSVESIGDQYSDVFKGFGVLCKCDDSNLSNQLVRLH